MLNTISINWELLGSKLAALSGDEQSSFFTGFARELDGYESHHLRELQMACVSDNLDSRAKVTLERYIPMLWYSEDAPI